MGDQPCWSVSNKNLEIAVSAETKGGLSSFIDLKSGRNFISSEPCPLYRLVLFEKGKDPMEVTSLDAETFDVQRSSSSEGEILVLTYGLHRSLEINVTCRLLLEAESSVSKWQISVENNTSYGIRSIHYPVVVAPSTLGESDEDDRFIWGYFGGQIIKNPHRSVKPRGSVGWLPVQYPGVISFQFQAYYDKTAGLYMATYDDAGYIKGFGIDPREDDFDLSIKHNFDESPGLSFHLPYDTVLGVFHGDWYEAADIYKEWAHRQHWCAKRTIERDDIPSWVKEPRPWLCIISRGNYDRLRGILPFPPGEFPISKFWPAKKVVPLMREYASIFGTPVVTWMEGWEKIGAPGGPVEIFPPLEGTESFRAAMEELSSDGNHPFMYLAGFHWCYKRPSVGYDDWERFETEGRPLAAINDQGGLDISDLSARTYLDGQKYFVPLCIGSDDTQELYLKNFLQLVDLGAVSVQLDQQLGFYPLVCYSEGHDHAPGYGLWMHRKTLEFIRRTREEIRQRKPESTLSVETPCEIWIQELDLFMHRPYMLGFIPLFDYIYHEYIPCYGGDVRMGLCHPEVSLIKHATCFVYGIQNLVGIGEPEYDFEVNPDYPVLTLLRNICQAQRTYAHAYLTFGQMLKPTDLEVSKVSLDLYMRAGSADVPRVLHGVWRSPEGKIGYVLINWTGAPEKVKLWLAKTDGVVSVITAGDKKVVPEEQVKTGNVTVTVRPRDILLLEQD